VRASTSPSSCDNLQTLHSTHFPSQPPPPHTHTQPWPWVPEQSASDTATHVCLALCSKCARAFCDVSSDTLFCILQLIHLITDPHTPTHLSVVVSSPAEHAAVRHQRQVVEGATRDGSNVDRTRHLQVQGGGGELRYLCEICGGWICVWRPHQAPTSWGWRGGMFVTGVDTCV